MSVRIGTLSVSMLSICTARHHKRRLVGGRELSPLARVHVHHQAANLPRSRRGMLALGCSLMLLVAAGGCQSRSTPEPSVAEAEPGPESHSPENHSANPAADGESPVGPVKLTESQRAVLQLVEQAGGSFDGDGESAPTLIDLASDRVFADEELVQALGEFTELSRLRLAVANTIPSAFENLKGLGQLTELLLQGAPLTDLQLAELLQCMPGLERLTLRRLSRVTDQIGPTLMNCRRLRVLALIEMNGISGATLSQLTSHEGLRSLDLRNCGQLTVEDYRLLHQMAQLTELKLGGPAVNDEVISLIASHPALSSLAIEDAEVSGDCLRKLAASPQLAQRLERLAFARCFGITDDALAGLERFPLLKSLTLRSLFVTGSFLALSDEQSQRPLTLETLVVTDGFLTDDVVSEFPARIPDIVRLDLSGNAGITNASLKVFEKLGVLEYLSLDRTGVLADAQEAAQDH